MSVEKLMRGLLDFQNRKSQTEKQAQRRCDGSDCEVLKEFSESQTVVDRTTSFEEESSVAPASGPTTPLSLTRRLACYSSFYWSCDLEALNVNSLDEDEFVASMSPASGPTTPLSLMTQPACYSSSSSSCDLEALHANSQDEDEFVAKLKSSPVFELEKSVVSLRKLTRIREEMRVQLCTPRILTALRPLIVSRYASVQVNAATALLNLSS